MTYAGLRFADVQSVRPFGVNADSTHGTLLISNRKKTRGQNWPMACHRMGLTGATDWIQPIAQLRAAYSAVNGRDAPRTSPRLGRKGLLVAEGPSPYSATRRKLVLLRTTPGDPDGESYTLHSPGNLFPTATNQMISDRSEMAIIGHWPTTSRMPERYDSSVGAIDLLLRSATVHQIVDGRGGVTPAYHLPATATGHLRVGKSDGPRPPARPSDRQPVNGRGATSATPTDKGMELMTRPWTRLLRNRLMGYRAKLRRLNQLQAEPRN